MLFYLSELGYDTEPYETFSVTEIQSMWDTKSEDGISSLDFELKHQRENAKTCKVHYYTKPSSMKQQTLETTTMSYYEDHPDKENSTLIIIMQGNINDTTMKTIKNMWKKFQEYVIVFEMKSLLFNLFTHTYVPKHIKLTSDEKKKVKLEKNISDDSQIPEISIFDPMAKALMMRPGDMCKIIRYDKISLTNEFYRLCVI
tara:strand:+ start:373 stop:972 length:600 start_codon:yes stop_codon:yes gene_type:complete